MHLHILVLAAFFGFGFGFCGGLLDIAVFTDLFFG
jgi:hypothetical protein